MLSKKKEQFARSWHVRPLPTLEPSSDPASLSLREAAAELSVHVYKLTSNKDGE